MSFLTPEQARRIRGAFPAPASDWDLACRLWDALSDALEADAVMPCLPDDIRARFLRVRALARRWQEARS